MAKEGDTKDVGGGATRQYYNSRWDSIKDKDGNQYWRDKENHKTHKSDSSLTGMLLNDFVGGEVEEFDDDGQDEMWDEEDGDEDEQ